MYPKFLPLILATALGGTAAELPRADTILDRYVEVTGGAEAYEKLKTQHSTGTIEFLGQGVKGTIDSWSALPDHNRTVMDLGGVGKVVYGTGQGRGWHSSPTQETRLLEGPELRQSLRSSRLNGAVRWRELYSAAITQAEETVDQQVCYRVALKPADGGKNETSWYSKESGLLVKTSTMLVTPGGDVPMENFIADYRTVAGVKVPCELIQKVGAMTIKTVLTLVELNAVPPNGMFVTPPEIRRLITAQAVPE